MAAAWQASGTLLGSAGADFSPVIPAHAANDILIVLTASRLTSEFVSTAPAGWTALGSASNTNWGGQSWWLRATGSAETNPLLDFNANTAEKYAQVHTIRGAITTGDFWAARGSAADLTDPITASGASSVSTTLNNQLVCVIGLGSDNASSSVTVTATDPASFTQRHFSTITTGADATGSFHDATRATAGAVGTITLDHNSTMPAEFVVVIAVLEPGAAYQPRQGFTDHANPGVF